MKTAYTIGAACLILAAGFTLGTINAREKTHAPQQVANESREPPASPDAISVTLPGQESARFDVADTKTQSDVQGKLAPDEFKVVLWYFLSDGRTQSVAYKGKKPK